MAQAKIDAIIHCILGNEVDFFHAFSGEARGFGDDRFHRAASLFAPHQGDRAERAIAVAAFGDFYIGAMGLSETEARGVRLVQIGGLADPEPLLPLLWRQQVPANFRDLPELPGPHHAVEFRQLLEEVPLIPLRQTAGGNQHPAGSCFFQFAMRNDRIDGFLLGFFDKSTRINDDDFCFLRVIGQGKPVRYQGA